MLVEFSVENFRSIKDEVTLSLVASPDLTLQDNIIPKSLKAGSLLRSTAIYGANASGKTNIVQAIVALVQLVNNSQNQQSGQPMPYAPFKLDPKCLDRPTKMRVSFIHKSVKYVYGVSYNQSQVIDEYLYAYPNDKKAVVFERTKTVKYKFNTDESIQNKIKELTSTNVLYLSKAAQNNYAKAQEVLDWFTNGITVVGPENPETLYIVAAKTLDKYPSLKPLLLKALSQADLGINDIISEYKSLPREEFIKNNPDFPEEFTKMIPTNKGNIESAKIRTFHNKVEFNFDSEESAGTKRMFGLAVFFVDALKNGKVLVVDELDTRLHHKLNLFLIRLFHDSKQNKENAQLIFTTHNVKLLDLDEFRRDQIWFTQKDPTNGDTELFSLVEFGVRKDKDIEKAYLAGRYGATPFIKENKVF